MELIAKRDDFGEWFGRLIMVGVLLGFAWSCSQAAQQLMNQPANNPPKLLKPPS